MSVKRVSINIGTLAPARAVVRFREVRNSLAEKLNFSEGYFGIDTGKTRLMPYAIVVGAPLAQKVFPIGKENGLYSFHLAYAGKPGWHPRVLQEYSLIDSGLIVCGSPSPQGLFVAPFGGRFTDMRFPVSGEHYGKRTHPWALLTGLHPALPVQRAPSFLPRSCSINERVGDLYSLIASSAERVIVTLTPDDDITGILNGRYFFRDGAWAKPAILP